MTYILAILGGVLLISCTNLIIKSIQEPDMPTRLLMHLVFADWLMWAAAGLKYLADFIGFLSGNAPRSKHDR